jgi:hypothetical protein
MGKIVVSEYDLLNIVNISVLNYLQNVNEMSGREVVLNVQKK